MSNESGTIRTVAWNDVFPWLMIFRSLSLAASVPILFLATVGILLMPLGWWGAEAFLSNEDLRPIETVVEQNHAWPGQFRGDAGRPASPLQMPGSVREFVAPMWQMVTGTIEPFRRLFGMDTTLSQVAYFTFGGLWTMLVWSLFGGAINRIAVMKLGRQERVGMVDALRFATRRYLSYLLAPLFPLAGALAMVVAATCVGLVMRFDIGVFLVALIWIFVLLGGLLMTLLLLGLMCGWPLMWGAISAEEMGDVFEAAQRCYSFTFGRPFHYLFYAVTALLVGSAGFVLVSCCTQAVVYLSYWSVSWGAGTEALNRLAAADSSVVFAGNFLIQLLNGVVLSVAAAFRYSFFWAAAAAVYLLLRRDNDLTEFDDVFAEEDQQAIQLPPLARDEEGVPGVSEPENTAE